MLKLKKNKPKGNTVLLVIVALGSALLTGIIVYFWQLNKQNQETQKKVIELEKKVNNFQTATKEKEEGKFKNDQKSSKEINNNDSKTSIEKSETSNDTEINFNQNKPVKSATENWQVYKNKEYKYLIKYPNNWDMQVIDKEFEMVPGKQVKYITFNPKNSTKYVLALGIKDKNDSDVMITDRTGMPAGQIVSKKIFLGKKYTVKVDIIKDTQTGNAIDIAGKETPIDNKHLAIVSISYFGNQNNIDLLDSYEYQVMQKILDTFKFYN